MLFGAWGARAEGGAVARSPRPGWAQSLPVLTLAGRACLWRSWWMVPCFGHCWLG